MFKNLMKSSSRRVQQESPRIFKLSLNIRRDQQKFSARGPLKRFVEDGKVLTALVKDWRTGKYRQALYGTIAAVVFGLIYVFNPLDLVPDVLPILGALDDATVIGALLMLVERDLRKYRSWKEGQLMVEDVNQR
jgi:uncharacterized membrane protein YkvA (DUF1232 family)